MPAPKALPAPLVPGKPTARAITMEPPSAAEASAAAASTASTTTAATTATAAVRAPGADAPFAAAPLTWRTASVDQLPEQSDSAVAYVLDASGRTILIAFPSLLDQGRVMGRIVFFIERAGTPKDRVMNAAEVADYMKAHNERIETLTYGNNFRGQELARFFNVAHAQGESLTPPEAWLLAGLLDMGVLRGAPGQFAGAEPERVVISVPQVSTVADCRRCGISAAVRAAILRHELSHARFVADDAYRERVLVFWDGLDEDTRGRFTTFLRKRGYDPGNRILMANEMQAFLGHTHDPAMFNAKAIDLSEPAFQALRERFATHIGS